MVFSAKGDENRRKFLLFSIARECSEFARSECACKSQSAYRALCSSAFRSVSEPEVSRYLTRVITITIMTTKPRLTFPEITSV